MSFFFSKRGGFNWDFRFLDFKGSVLFLLYYLFGLEFIAFFYIDLRVLVIVDF